MKPLLINGEWLTTTDVIENISPSDLSDIIDVYAQAGRAEAQKAIAAATDAAPLWAASTPRERHDVLKNAATEISARSQDLGQLLAREEGKTLKEGIAEVRRAASIFDYFAGEALRQSGELVPSVRAGIDIEVTREPIGPVGIITPWNFPIAIPAWKIAPALCFGNTVVFKPAEIVPGCAWELTDILNRSGLPDGVINLVMGKGSVVGQEMLDSPFLAGISFTGSHAVGKRIALSSADKMRKVQLEMGGKNPLVVLDDADLDTAVESAVNGAFHATGQRCTASSRLIVTEGIYSRFVEEMAERTRRLRVGHALHEATVIGPVVSDEQLSADLDYIAIARSQGGNLRCGGELVRQETEGYFLQPALFTDTTNDMRINREEVFGPVASVIRVRDYDEALQVANDTDFGLCSGICTNDLRYASHFRKHAQAGMVMVNLPTAGVDFHVPFGGRKASNFGPREQGAYAKEFYTAVKTAYISA